MTATTTVSATKPRPTRGANIRGIIRALNNLDDTKVKGDGDGTFWYCEPCGKDQGKFLECGTCPRCGVPLTFKRN